MNIEVSLEDIYEEGLREDLEERLALTRDEAVEIMAVSLPIAGLDEFGIYSSRDLWNNNDLPKKLRDFLKGG